MGFKRVSERFKKNTSLRVVLKSVKLNAIFGNGKQNCFQFVPKLRFDENLVSLTVQ